MHKILFAVEHIGLHQIQKRECFEYLKQVFFKLLHLIFSSIQKLFEWEKADSNTNIFMNILNKKYFKGTFQTYSKFSCLSSSLFCTKNISNLNEI